MDVCKTDVLTICRYLDTAAAFYLCRGGSTRDTNRARLLKNMSAKLRDKERKAEPDSTLPGAAETQHTQTL